MHNCTWQFTRCNHKAHCNFMDGAAISPLSTCQFSNKRETSSHALFASPFIRSYLYYGVCRTFSTPYVFHCFVGESQSHMKCETYLCAARLIGFKAIIYSLVYLRYWLNLHTFIPVTNSELSIAAVIHIQEKCNFSSNVSLQAAQAAVATY